MGRRVGGRVGLGARGAGHEGPGRGRARRLPRPGAQRLAAAAGELLLVVTCRRGDRRGARRPLALRAAPRQGAERLRRSTRAAAGRSRSRGAASTRSASARRGLPLPRQDERARRPRLAAEDRRERPAEAGSAWSRVSAISRRPSDPPKRAWSSSRLSTASRRGRAGVQRGLERMRADQPLLAAFLAEPMLGATLTPTKIKASEKANVIPSSAEALVDCRVPPGKDADWARQAIEACWGRAITSSSSARRSSATARPSSRR